MKNYYLKTLLLLFCFVSVAGVSQAQIKYGIKVGANASSLIGFQKLYNEGKPDAEQIATEMKIGYQGGLSLDLSAGKFFFRPELDFSAQGLAAKLKSETDDPDIEAAEFNLYYLKLPVHVGYKQALNMDTDIRFGAGYYVSYLIDGANDDFIKDYKFKSLDHGLSVMAAYDYVNMSVSISYEYGLVDMVGIDEWSKYKEDNKLSAIRNSCFNLSVAYYF